MRRQLDKINDELGKECGGVEQAGVNNDSEALTPSKAKIGGTCVCPIIMMTS